MKKNLIYTVTFLLCGALSITSCEDMLNVESDRVEYEFDDWTFNDSVYSVLGILKGVQEVGDRQVLLNELRADLVTINEAKAVTDVQEIAKSEFNVATNKYLDVKDYYSIINNCNIYLARVDTTLTKDNVKLMLPEYVAVKSVRAWTYLQLAINHNEIPYFTNPILTHSAAQEVMDQPKLSRNEVLNNLIADILPYENPSIYTMPAWEKDGKVLKYGYGDEGQEVETKKLFMPIRMLLADMYLWLGDYRNAAQFYYDQITGARTNSTAEKYTDNVFTSSHFDLGGESFNTNFASLFSVDKFKDNNAYVFSLIPYANSAMLGTVSELSNIFLPVSDPGGSQAVASPGMISLSQRQVFRYAKGTNLEKPDEVEYSNENGYKTKGDLRLISTTCSQLGKDEAKTEYKNLIAKFNLENNQVNSEYEPKIPSVYIMLSRPEHAYLRFAEALMGLERDGYTNAMKLAMTVLKVGVKDSTYNIYKNPVYADSIRLNFAGNPILLDSTVNEFGETEYIYATDSYMASYDDKLTFDFSHDKFKVNKGIHSRGSGDSERNKYFALDSINVARYFGKTTILDNGQEVLDASKHVTEEEFRLFVSEIILDEMALELAWEGSRFGDLVRVATALNDPSVLAKRVAGRAFHNTVSHRHHDFQYDNAIFSKMSDESNWYLPLPGDEVVEPGEVVDTPEDFDPSVDTEI